MSVQNYIEARRLVDDTGVGDFEGAKPEQLVAKAENVLGLRFPPSYRRFLLEMGCGSVNGFEVYGLINDNFEKSTVPNGIWLTLDERRSIGLDHRYILISESGDGSYYAIDTENLDNAKEAAVVRLSADGHSHEKVANSFGSYFLESVRAVV
jgi:antitoxin YobK